MERPPATTYRVDGRAIRERRKHLGMDVAECAAKTGISRPYLSELETGRKRRMKPPTYAALRTTLQIAPDDRQLLDPSQEHDRKD